MSFCLMGMSSVVNIFKLGFDVSLASHIPHHSTSSKSSSSEITDTDEQDQWASAGRGRRASPRWSFSSLFSDCGENTFYIQRRKITTINIPDTHYNHLSLFSFFKKKENILLYYLNDTWTSYKEFSCKDEYIKITTKPNIQKWPVLRVAEIHSK